MKKLIFAFAFASLLLSSCSDEDKFIDPADLPEGIKSFVQENFQWNTIARATVDNDSYDIELGNGNELSFSKKGALKSIDCNHFSVPQNILEQLPEPIRQYISENYPNQKVSEFSIDRNYEIELKNGIDLIFDKKGKFLRMDQ